MEELEDKMEMEIQDLDDLLRIIGVTNLSALQKVIFKSTDCGASVQLLTSAELYSGGSPIDDDVMSDIHPEVEVIGVVLGSIVEGVDWGTEEYELLFPFTEKEFNSTLDDVESEANDIWNDTHGCDSCPENPETGYHMIDSGCPECNGEGSII